MEISTITKPGFIIAICGGPGTGKSTLVNKLTEHYGATPIFEGEEFPERVKENLRDNKNQLESRIFFRNLLTKMHIEAERLKQAGKLVIMDTFWLTNNVYTETWLEHDFHKELMNDMYELDAHFLSMPDLMIILESDKERIKEFMMKRGRLFELSDSVLDRFVNAGSAHRDFFKRRLNAYFIDRSKLDFHKPNHFKMVTDLIDKKYV
ncbi:MAG: AAA family ATPase [Candidatus Falkowbacteria bacterium]|nr:AAA family ATPase [Candidatus Falkowbacteria bacterium]